MKTKYNFLIAFVMVFGAITACTPKSNYLREDGLQAKANNDSFTYGEEEGGDFNLKEKEMGKGFENIPHEGVKNPYLNDSAAFNRRMKAMPPVEGVESGSEKGEKIDQFDQTGIASWYGKEFHGRRTASGEPFDMKELTAAHKTLPFGTVVEVRNIENGKSVKVKINDRGPYKNSRVLDLSYASAKELGMIADGEAMVGINILGKEKKELSKDLYSEDNVSGVSGEKSYAGNSSARGGEYPEYEIQAGAFYSKKNADKLKSKLEALFTNAVVIYKDGDLYKVRILGINSKDEADRYRVILKDENISSFVINK